MLIRSSTQKPAIPSAYMANTLLVICVETVLKLPLSNRTWMIGTAKAENSAENGRITNSVFSTVPPT